ncbi:MAG: CidA/LrgA family protein [Firmicutes bacterium]|nr:CidA/LrgA family protein [Bacillota bacterium]
MTIIKKIIFNFILPLGILFAFQFFGIILNKYLINFMPGPVIGMLLLLAALSFKIIPFRIIENFSLLLVKHISFFLIPTSVSLIIILPQIESYFIRIMLMLVLSLTSVIIVTSSFASLYSRKTIKGDPDE